MNWMEANEENVVMFYPHVPKDAILEVSKVLSSRFIGQGPKVREFELLFEEKFNLKNAVSVNSGTSALHLAYLLAGIEQDDEVICPVFTCTATNIPLRYIGAKPIFVDVNPLTMNIDVSQIKKAITNRTKAIVTVDFGGLPCDYDEIKEIAIEHNLAIIQDAAHSLGSEYKGNLPGTIADFTIFSFQAIKHLTTGDGGMLVMKDATLAEKAKRLRWFGIDRSKKSAGIWENDISEIGYKYHMNDIAAAIGIAGLREFDEIIKHRRDLSQLYFSLLSKNPDVISVGASHLQDRIHGGWLHTILVEDRAKLVEKLLKYNIESSPVHYRNDKYSIFGKYSQKSLPNMDSIETKYLCLPLHTKITDGDVERICKAINEGW